MQFRFSPCEANSFSNCALQGNAPDLDIIVHSITILVYHRPYVPLTCYVAVLFMTNALVSGYNVISRHTKVDILDGTGEDQYDTYLDPLDDPETSSECDGDILLLWFRGLLSPAGLQVSEMHQHIFTI